MLVNVARAAQAPRKGVSWRVASIDFVLPTKAGGSSREGLCPYDPQERRTI